jgi:hypothetical protein
MEWSKTQLIPKAQKVHAGQFHKRKEKGHRQIEKKRIRGAHDV